MKIELIKEIIESLSYSAGLTNEMSEQLADQIIIECNLKESKQVLKSTLDQAFKKAKLNQAIEKAKPNMDKIEDVDAHLNEIK